MNSKYAKLQDEIIKDYVDNKLSYIELKYYINCNKKSQLIN